MYLLVKLSLFHPCWGGKSYLNSVGHTQKEDIGEVGGRPIGKGASGEREQGMRAGRVKLAKIHYLNT